MADLKSIVKQERKANQVPKPKRRRGAKVAVTSARQMPPTEKPPAAPATSNEDLDEWGARVAASIDGVD